MPPTATTNTGMTGNDPPSQPPSNSSSFLPEDTMGKSDKTLQGYGTALSYIKRYLVSSSNVSYPKKWEDFTEEHGEGDQPRIILQRIGLWLGTTAFKIGQSNKFLSEKNKVTYYKGMKEVVKLRYPNNTLFAPNSQKFGE